MIATHYICASAEDYFIVSSEEFNGKPVVSVEMFNCDGDTQGQVLLDPKTARAFANAVLAAVAEPE